jgi:hypothetical protein
VLITVFLLLPFGWCWLRRHRASRRRTNAVLAKLGYIHRSASPRGAAPYDGVSALASNKRYIHMESELEPLSPVPDSHIRDAFACGNSVVTDTMSEREQRKVAEDLEQQQRQPVQGGRQYGQQQQQQQHWKNNSNGYNGSSARRSSGVLARNAPHLMSRDMSTIASSAAGGSISNSSGTTTSVSSGDRHNMPVAQPVVVVHTAVTSSNGNGHNRNGQHHRRHQHAASTSTNSVHSFNSVDLSDSGSVQHQQRHHHGDIPVAQAVLAPSDSSSSAGMSAAQRAVLLRQSARGARTSLTHATSGHNAARLLDINGAPIEYNPWQRDSSNNSIISTTSSIGGARDSGQGWERVWLSQSGNSNSSGSQR